MIHLPPDFRGARTAAKSSAREKAYRTFADQLQTLHSTLAFKVSSRGWCYILEDHGLTKDQFDLAENRINTCRKEGWLPLDFTADDSARGPKGINGTHSDYPLEQELKWIWEDRIQDALDTYAPVRWVDFQSYYVEVGVEKVDLVELNMPVCREVRAMVSNFRGDTDINSKAQMSLRFQQAIERGQQPVLLVEGDFDPKGLHIHEYMRKQFLDLEGRAFADGTRLAWDPRELIIVRFGLNEDFIDAHGLSKIPNLITGSGRDLASPTHPDRVKKKAYIENYLRDYGAWKCEANSLVVRVEEGRRLMRDALEPYIDRDGIRRYNEAVAQAQAEIRQALPDFLRNKLAA